MSKPCPFEDAVAAAARSGDWRPELRAHRDGCLSCAELTLVVAALAADAEELAAIDVPLPDPAPIWLRARLASREQQFQRATRTIVWVQRAAVALAVAVGLAFAPGLWELVSGMFSGINLSLSAPDLPRAAGSPLLVLVVSMLVLGGLALWELTAQEN
ncbi:MAG: hypothetical protein OQK55_00330 [Thermoanaerobaculales bacterium]|nr:hypothetical protein [Thermoanaerobaculales bacterium]